MTTEIATENEERVLVENFRATGYAGREPWISALDAVTGTRVVAVRQLEACATYPACAWRDDVADEVRLWSFMRECLLKPLLSFARIVEASIPTVCVSGDANGNNYLALAWKSVSQLLDRLANAEPPKTSYPETAVSFLLAVMVLRQIVDAEARGEDVDQTRFVLFSTNVHPTFLPALFEKLGAPLIDLAKPFLLPDLCSRLEARSRGDEA
jgi:hypothetical protein